MTRLVNQVGGFRLVRLGFWLGLGNGLGLVVLICTLFQMLLSRKQGQVQVRTILITMCRKLYRCYTSSLTSLFNWGQFSCHCQIDSYLNRDSLLSEFIEIYDMILDVQLIFIIYIVSTSENSTYLNTIQYHFSVESGEKIGIQITILLADIIYVAILQSTVPIFDTYRNTPYVLTFFVMSITLLCIGLLVTARTLFLYHCPEYEARNFSRTEARISVAIAK